MVAFYLAGREAVKTDGPKALPFRATTTSRINETRRSWRLSASANTTPSATSAELAIF